MGASHTTYEHIYTKCAMPQPPPYAMPQPPQLAMPPTNAISQCAMPQHVMSNNNNSTLNIWLNNIGLSEYYDLFISQGFDDVISSLSDLTDNDLKQIGIVKLGHRKLLLRSIQIFNNNDINNNWSEYVRMFTNVGWSEIPRPNDPKYYALFQEIKQKTNNTPSRIRSKQQFIEIIDNSTNINAELIHDIYTMLNQNDDEEIKANDGEYTVIMQHDDDLEEIQDNEDNNNNQGNDNEHEAVPQTQRTLKTQFKDCCKCVIL